MLVSWRSSFWVLFPVCRQAATRNPTEGNGTPPVFCVHTVLDKRVLGPQGDVLACVGFPGCGLVIGVLFCLELQQFHTLSSAHSIFFFFLHRRTETVRCSCQCSLALPSYIKNNSHIKPCGILSNQWEHPGMLLSSLGKAAGTQQLSQPPTKIFFLLVLIV